MLPKQKKNTKILKLKVWGRWAESLRLWAPDTDTLKENKHFLVGGKMNRFISIIIIKSWLTEETDHTFPNQSKRSCTVPASPGLSSSSSVIPRSDQVSLQTSHKIPTTAPQLLTLSVGTWNCGRRKDKNYVWTKGGCQETSSIMREPWFAAVRALRETLWSAFSPLFIKTRFEKKQKKKRILKKKHGMKDLPFPPNHKSELDNSNGFRFGGGNAVANT